MDISTDVEKVKNFKDMSRCRHVTQQNILFHLIKKWTFTRYFLGGALFAKRKEKAASWIVDDSTVGRMNPGSAADKFIQEQSEQQLVLQQQKMFEQQQKFEQHQQQVAAKEAEQLQQQREAQAAFMQQQQFKQEQSMEVRRIQEAAASARQEQLDLPPNFQHANIKGRPFTPSLDLGCHNVQGINVWANTAPRGWGSAQSK